MSIVSVLIPTRGRTPRLFKAIKSIFDTTRPGQVDIILRMDEDDSRACSMRDELVELGCKVLIGPRLQGYSSLPTFIREMSDVAKTYWIMLFNDDAVIEGTGWVDYIEQKGEGNAVFQAEHHCLGGSHYLNDTGGPFPIMPRNCWQQFGRAEPPSDADRWVYYFLSHEQRWPLHFIKGMTVRHDR